MTIPPAWWVDRRNLIHFYESERYAQIKVYARLDERKWEYAIVEWRSGSAYLTGLYRDGKSLETNRVLSAIELVQWMEHEVRSAIKISSQSKGSRGQTRFSGNK